MTGVSEEAECPAAIRAFESVRRVSPGTGVPECPAMDSQLVSARMFLGLLNLPTVEPSFGIRLGYLY